MSRELGSGLDDRLISDFLAGISVLVTWVVDGEIVSRVGKAVSATADSVRVELVGEECAEGNVSVHTLGPSICAVRGSLAKIGSAPHGALVQVSVSHVKDDRPPGLDVRPFRLKLE